MNFPDSLADQLRCVATETARMSYPGSMSRGKSPIVSSGTKAKLEAYFVKRLPLHEVWTSAESVAEKYDAWHQAQVKGISRAIAANVQSDNFPMSVAAKFLNTFMHQLTKYEEARILVPRLHLPLDVRVFSALRRIES